VLYYVAYVVIVTLSEKPGVVDLEKMKPVHARDEEINLETNVGKTQGTHTCCWRCCASCHNYVNVLFFLHIALL
jgi:hypothetical protein